MLHIPSVTLEGVAGTDIRAVFEASQMKAPVGDFYKYAYRVSHS